MNSTRRLAAAGVWAILVLAGCRQAQDPPQIGVTLAGMEGRIAGPSTHKNLTVFLIDSSEQDGRDFLTLDEGLTKGLVKVSENEQEQVGELRIDNQSDRPLYLQEGERLQGGKQDRTIIASMVVPPRSGWTPLRSFCVEHNRWTAGVRGQGFGFVANAALAPKSVRGEAKIDGSQEGVWRCVAVQKANAYTFCGSSNKNSSLNEMLDSPAVQTISEEYADALAGLVDQDPDAVGVVLAVNGQLEEADVYPNHQVLQKLYPRLIRSYAVQAEMLKNIAKETKVVSTSDVGRLLEDGAEQSKREDKVNAHNTLTIRTLEGNRYQCATEYDGKVVHWQVMKKNGAVVAARGGRSDRRDVLGSDW
ncbi:MAG TPA: hypothetical protein DDY78_08580 [Planctomycetales bacterium]|jgi:hypothetical protein|nr:hypothetical protein [Planctomycetales bacterium]